MVGEARCRGNRAVVRGLDAPVDVGARGEPVGIEQQVGATVQCLVDLGPRVLACAVDQCEPGRILGGALFREGGHQGPIRRPPAGRSKSAWRNRLASIGMVSGTCWLALL